VSGILLLCDRIAIARAAFPDAAEKPPHRLNTELFDVETVVSGGTVPGMSEATRARIVAEMQKLKETNG
jgi:hypothetical protein